MTNLPSLRSKILSREDLAHEFARRQAAGERGVFTNGCFDLLHLGHVRYLRDARALGNFLAIGLNSDESTRLLKGPGRPLVSADERAEILAALVSVTYVTIFAEKTANALIELLQPSIYVKGGDYAGAQGDEPDLARLPEASSVLAYGGSVRLISYLSGHSTTELIAKIRRLPES